MHSIEENSEQKKAPSRHGPNFLIPFRNKSIMTRLSPVNAFSSSWNMAFSCLEYVRLRRQIGETLLYCQPLRVIRLRG